MWHLGTQISVVLGSAGRTVGLADLGVLFQPNDSMILRDIKGLLAMPVLLCVLKLHQA